jgi:hypothetical protein
MRLLFFFVLLTTSVSAQTLTLAQCREKFEKAATDCKALIDGLKSVTVDKDPVLYGYLGAAETIYAQYSYNPYSKLSLFGSGQKKIEAAIAKKPDSIELRYLRFTVQSGAPSFLGYNTKLTDDKTKILAEIKALAASDADLHKRITAYLKQSTNVTAAEKKQLD